ncbi:MAG TPA: pyrroline-5-carboxylate reductase [Bacillota bacterium]
MANSDLPLNTQSTRLDGRRIALIGAGEMAEALVAGLLSGGALKPEQISLTNRSGGSRLRQLARAFGVCTNQSKAAMLAEADVAILAVKPADADVALTEIAPLVRRESVVVSVMAGIPLAYLADRLPGHARLVRAMPNAASRVGRAVTALCRSVTCDDEAFALAHELFSQVGITVTIDESLFDAVTAISGSGPAYVYLLVEGMLEAARSLGLPDDVARRLTVQTVIGAGAMLSATPLSPGELRRQVTSPGGTTAAALEVLKDAGFLPIVHRAVCRAAERAAELARTPGSPSGLPPVT